MKRSSHRQQARKQGKPRKRTVWLRAGIMLIALCLIVVGEILTLRGAFQGSTILTILGVAIGLLQWLFPLSTDGREPSNVSLPLPVLAHTVTENQLAMISSQRIWNVPYPRNPLITGREKVLAELHEVLATGISGEPQALTGLGGIGKTQIAIEYAYRFVDEYQAVLWVNVASQETLTSDVITIAHLLKLPEKDVQDLHRVITAVRQWLHENDDWLLILDNANSLTTIKTFLPTKRKGHVLLTTRTYALGTIAHKIEVNKLDPEAGTLFLLRRARRLIQNDTPAGISDAEFADAQAISHAVDALPLALDQAGAYIEETACDVRNYLYLYKTQRAALLGRRGKSADYYPAPVATTWALSFSEIEQSNPAAAELLHLCAFLHPDAIPESLITRGAPYFGSLLQVAVDNPLEWDAAIEGLLTFSLLRRDPSTKILTVHRLVQDVLRDAMSEQDQLLWAERAVRAVSRAFSQIEFATWSYCQQCLPHAYLCLEYIERWRMDFKEAMKLLQQTGAYLHERAQFKEAEPLLQQALAVRERTLGHEHPDVTASLIHLANLYHDQGKYSQAEPLLQRALAIHERASAVNHPDLGGCLTCLGLLYWDQGKYAQAEPLLQRALSIQEAVLGPEHRDVATTLNILGLAYSGQGKNTQAEIVCRRALAIREKVLGLEHPTIAESLNNLAYLISVQGKYSQAESLYQRALALRMKTLAPEHTNLATSLNSLAKFYLDRGQYAQAEPLLKRALTIREKALGPEHPRVATVLNNFGDLLFHQGRYKQAKQFCLQALAICEKALAPEHLNLVPILNNLATIYIQEHQYGEADALLKRALSIGEQALGAEDHDVALSLRILATLLESQGRYAESEPLLKRVIAIRELVLGPEHPDTVRSIEDYVAILRKMKRKEDAEKLVARIKEIEKKHHP